MRAERLALIHFPLFGFLERCRDGETGRREGLKIPFP
jgi:hypothetical protein